MAWGKEWDAVKRVPTPIPARPASNFDNCNMKTYPLYLNGEFVVSDPAWDVVNPATGEAFARISTVDRRRVGRALAADCRAQHAVALVEAGRTEPASAPGACASDGHDQSGSS